LIEKLKSEKASGCDGVPTILLKNIPGRVAVFLFYIFNSCFKLCHFPKQWRHAIVNPILKLGRDHSDLSNYRPISLFSSISKILDRIILKRLNAFISGHNVLPNHQFGCKAAHSTTHQLNRVVACQEQKGTKGVYFVWSWKGLLILYGTMHFYINSFSGVGIFS
jgi:hypothetical protein